MGRPALANLKRHSLSLVVFGMLIFNASCTILSSAQSKFNYRSDSKNVNSIASRNSFEPRGDTRLAGVWTTLQKDYSIAFLPDGRVASFNHKFDNYTESDSHITIEIGVYHVEGNKVSYEWLITNPQSEYFEGASNQLVFFTVPGSPYKTQLNRVGGSDEAVSYYAQLRQKRLEKAEEFMSMISTGPAKRGPLQMQPYYNHDPNPTDIITGATVYTTYAKYSWVEGRHTYIPISPDDPGITFQSYILMPNGRFIYDAWLHGFLTFDNFPNAEPRNDQERRDRTVSAKHWQIFGKYRIVNQGDALQGDTVELMYPDGSHKTVQIVSGRQYMRVPGSNLNFINIDYSKLEQARQRR